jgi:hypothetical protein
MKVIYDTNQQKLLKYPRSDDQPLQGLSEGLYVLDLVEVLETIQDPSTQTLESFQEIDLDQGTVTKGMRVRNFSQEEIAINRRMRYPDAEVYQVREWMIRNGANPDTIVYSVIDAVFTDPIDNAVQKDRWGYIVRVPRDHPLVNAVGGAMGLTPEQIDNAWLAILTS